MTKAKGVIGRRVWQPPACLAAATLLGAAAVPVAAAANSAIATSPVADASADTPAIASATAAANPHALPAAPDARFQLARILHQDDFHHGLSDWVIESERTARVTA